MTAKKGDNTNVDGNKDCEGCEDCEYCYGAKNQKGKAFLWFDEQLTMEEWKEKIKKI